MQLSDAAEIQEMFGVENVNKALRDGWRLLAATSVHRNTSETDVCYTLGKPAPESMEQPNPKWVV